VALTKHCLPPMVARGRGRILNVASTAAFVPGPRMSVYYASKAFVVSFSNAIGDELRDSGVTVSALCPGPTATGFQARARLHRSRLFRGTVMEAAPVAEAGYRGMMRGDRLIVPGMTNKMVPLAARLFPRRIVTAASRRAAEEA
jgi:short-subunit dehydrogenase